ncbi:MAG TPA: tetratricopeptide repeat-containing sensor histidine kinase [Candidatus Cloacimonadota bacterium]|nr:tetratricopeptide repeat-containing sensor histidine kinase [Candidatus Cloacimonadota bacterium]
MSEIQNLKNQLQTAQETERIKLLLQIGDIYGKSGDKEKSEAYWQEALQTAQSCQDEQSEAVCYYKFGLLFWHKSNYHKALDYFTKALHLYEKLDLKLKIATMNMSIGITNWNLGNLPEAIQALRLTIYQFIKLKNKELLASSYCWLGIAYQDNGNQKKALRYYLKSLSLNEKIKNKRGIGITKNSIGLLHLEVGHLDLAKKYLSESLQIREEINDKQGIADSLNNLGMLSARNKQIDEALDYYQRSFDIRKNYGSRSKLSYILNNIANIYRDKGDFDKTLEYYQKSLVIREEIDNQFDTLQLLQNMAEFLIENDRLPESKIYLDRCVELQKIVLNRRLEKRNCQLFALYYEKNQDYQKAYEYHCQFSNLAKEISEKEKEEKLIEIHSQYEMEKQKQQTRLYQLKYVELQKANDTIMQQYKELESKNEYIRFIGKILRHDIINNMAVMKSAYRLYQNSQEKHYLEEISKQIDRSIRLITKIRNISELLSEKSKLIAVDLKKDVLDNLLANYPQIQIEITGNASVLANHLLESVFDNLISNAIKHGETNKIAIEIQTKEKDVQIYFKDFGKGIPAAIKTKIFEESFTYGQKASTGLGLFIVEKAVQNYGGTIQVEDNQPQGTVFIMNLKKA